LVDLTGCTEFKPSGFNPVLAHKAVIESGSYNFDSCKIKIPSKFNIDTWKYLLKHYPDNQICQYLEYGWPINYRSHRHPVSSNTNHSSADEYGRDIEQFIAKELMHGAIVGPFDKDPFQGNLVISPLQTVPKKGAGCNARRIVTDLSFPPGVSVNDGILNNDYLGEEYEVVYPTIDTFCEMVLSKGLGALMYKRDLSRAYRQLFVDPHDYNLLGFQWGGKLYFNTTLPFGLRSAAMACQRTTNAVSHIMHNQGHSVVNYVDDFGGVETPDRIQQAFLYLSQLFSSLGIEESVDKILFPSVRMIFLGVLVDSVNMTVEVPLDKLLQIKQELECWLGKKKASKRELQSLAGKLNFLAKCVKAGRVFMSRILCTLKSLKHNDHKAHLNSEFRKDIVWWHRFLPTFNGVSFIKSQEVIDIELFTDACLTGAGGLYCNQCYSVKFPQHILNQDWHISALEFLAIIIALKLWGNQWVGKNVLIQSDNAACVSVLNSGRARDSVMQICAREAMFVAASYDFTIFASHNPGRSNQTADILSRSETSDKYCKQRQLLCDQQGLVLNHVPQHVFEFISDW
jgi:hypothetical protein